MDKLHTMLRSIRGEAGESKQRNAHLDVFREFLAHLDRSAKRRAPSRAAKSATTKSTRKR